MTTPSPEGPPSAFIPRDTDPAAHALQVEAYRRMGGTARAAVMFRLSDFVRRVAIAGIKERHPEYDDEHVRLALARLCFGDELVSRAWAGRPLVEP